MSDLEGLFNEADANAARAVGDSKLEPGEFGSVRTKVRRAHTRRAVLRTFLVAGAAFAIGAGAVSGVKYLGGADVAGSPTPSASPSVAASPSPSPSEAGFAWPGFAGGLTTDPHVPGAQAITREVWALSGPGWALISYREQWTNADIEDRGPQVVYLVSPEGDRYELGNIPGDTVSVLAWEAGATTAAVSVQPEGDPPYAGVLDLVTGQVTPVDGYAPYIWSLDFLDPDGEPVWDGDESTFGYMKIGADGSATEFASNAVGNTAQTAVTTLDFPGIDCGEAAPYDDESALVVCWDNRFASQAPVDAADANRAVARVWPANDRVEVLHQSTYATPGADNPTRVGDYVVASTGRVGLDGCPTGYSVLSGGAAAPVPGWDASLHPGANSFIAFGAAGSTLTWGASSGCSGDVSPIVVVRSDLANGEFAVLMPYPADRPTGEDPFQSVTGVAVGR